MSNPSFYAVIPAHVRYCKDLEPLARLLYGEITALCSKEGYCWANNEYFADQYNVETRTVQRWLKSLKDKGFIFIEHEKDSKRKIWIHKEIKEKIRDDKNVTPPRQKCHPPMTKMSPIVLKPINTKEQQQANAVAFLINSLDLSDDEKESLMKWEFTEDQLRKAIEYCENSIIKKDLISTLIWHCQKKVPPKSNGSSKKSLLSRFKKGEIYNGYEFLQDQIGVGFYNNKLMQPYSVEYDSPNFNKEFEALLKKLGIEK